MDTATACEAVRLRKRLELRYDGFSRVVEVHAVGTSQDNHDVVRAWQVRGGSDSGEPVGWKLFRLDEAVSSKLIDEKSEAPRVGYKKGDRAMIRIRCQV